MMKCSGLWSCKRRAQANAKQRRGRAGGLSFESGVCFHVGFRGFEVHVEVSARFTKSEVGWDSGFNKTVVDLMRMRRYT